MSNTTTTPLDRRVLVIEGGTDDQEVIRRISDLRAIPFIVFLGEPGIGKSTVLEQEAAQEGVTALKIRDLMTEAQTDRSGTLFLDALDEYRVDGQPSDKVNSLAQSLTTAKVTRWRLSCRSEDWRKDADMAPIRKTTVGAPITVVQILPLDHDEAATVLVALGEGDPWSFLAKATSLGATGFIENPLSLRLLHTAVAGDETWPATRYDLFAKAVHRLVFERNEQHKGRRDRHGPDEILAASARANLLLLTSGSRAISRSNDELPAGSDPRAYVTVDAIGLDRGLLNDMLDTPLFRGEGEVFEPMHRTIAEYLAGEALAKAVAGSDSRAALPLSRAVALITDADGLPPTELRGLYAWFAAHLARLGEGAAAVRLIEIDAATVLAYGDAAAFDTAARRAILTNLDRNDPYFRASEVQATALGGLAGEDLAGDFVSILTSPPDGSHRLLTVFDALTNGPPVRSVRNVLRALVLDTRCSGWQRRRAFDAYLNGDANPADSRRELLDALGNEPPSIAREELRAQVAAQLSPNLLTDADVRSILSDYRKCPDDHMVGRLYALKRRLETAAVQMLFEQPVKNWFPPNYAGGHRLEIQGVLDSALAGSIKCTAELSGERLWRWISNVRGIFSSKLPDAAARALAAWLDSDVGHESALLDAALAHDDPAQWPWAIINNYICTTRRHPSPAAIEHMVAKAQSTLNAMERRRLLEIIVDVARRTGTDPNVYWMVYDVIAHEPDSKTLLPQLAVAEIESWRIEVQENVTNALEQEAEEKYTNVQAMARCLAEIRIGGRLGYLAWAADLYLRSEDGSAELSDDVQWVTDVTDETTTAAILAGWEYVATNGLDEISIEDLGKAEAKGESYCAEKAAIAGVDRLLRDDQGAALAIVPLDIAVVILKSSFVISNNDRRTRIERWALDRLNLDPAGGATRLIDYWNTALNAGATRLTSLWRLLDDDASGGAVAQAVESLLAKRPNMPPDALHAALRVGAKHLSPVRLLGIADAVLGDAAVTGEQRAIWSSVAFALDPVKHAERFWTDYGGNGGVELLAGDLIRSLIAAFVEANRSVKPHFNAMVVRVVGAKISSADDHPRRTVGDAINALAADPQPEVAAMLSALVSDPVLAEWQPSLRHAQAQQARLRRDRDFKHATPAEVRNAIAGGPPVNARDLRAVVAEELLTLRDELHTTDTTPWKNYWNLKGERVDNPLVENQCRDRLLDRLRDRLKKYKISAVVPEARRGEETRTDMLVFSQSGRNLPMEVKRHFHPDIWVSASSQLQDYTADPGADGLGIYLVFWFGNDINPTPARPDGSAGPTSAAKLESMLIRDLSPDLRTRTGVIVFDVSDPATPGFKKPRRRRGNVKQTKTNATARKRDGA